MHISAVIITCNEEKNIQRCLNSLFSVVDEIIIVDSFSTDNTENICVNFNFDNLKFIKQEWMGYAPQKNIANSMASNDTILSIDADEELSPKLQQEILFIKQQQFNDNVAFEFNRLTNYCGKWIKHGILYPDKKIRIFNRKSFFWKDIKVHEILHTPDNCKIIKLRGNLLHYPYKNLCDHRARINNYSGLYALYCYENNRNFSFLSCTMSIIWLFLYNYILRLGFIDGYYGLMILKMGILDKVLRYKKLKKLKQKTL